MNNHQNIRQCLIKVLRYIQTFDSENKHANVSLELEVRVGQMTTNYQFLPGYPYNHRQTCSKLIKRMNENCKVQQFNRQGCRYQWSKIDSFQFLRSHYPNNLRTTNIPNKPKSYMVKNRIACVDVESDRDFHIRIALSTEEKVNMNRQHPMYNNINRKPPSFVRMGQRWSFIETVQCESFPDWSFQFRYDITKLTVAGSNKAECRKEPCTYHVEMELYSKVVHSLTEQKNEVYLNLLSDFILARIEKLLLTHAKIPTDTHSIVLPKPKFQILKTNV